MAEIRLARCFMCEKFIDKTKDAFIEFYERKGPMRLFDSKDCFDTYYADEDK